MSSLQPVFRRKNLQPVRGTQDILPDTARRHRQVSETARRLAERYGFAEMATPIFEFAEVFARPIGETTDIVAKEMYTFDDHNGEKLALRPENTASVVRAILSNGLIQSIPLKLFYNGPMFRHERPQKGRFRQFHQIGVELIGVAHPQADIEVIALGRRILDELGVGHRIALELNSLGDTISRALYRGDLVKYLSDYASSLSEESRTRLQRNPLRILDSKDPRDQEIASGAPDFIGSLNPESRDFFARVCDGLDQLGIAYSRNPRLVRGLDYYTHTAFEFVTADLGAQGTVMGGGRYDGLVETMGGPPMPGVGWAAGIERLAMLIADPPPPPRPIAIIPIGDAGDQIAPLIAEDLRSTGYVVDLGYSGNLARRMRRANKLNASAAVMIGEDEIARGVATVRDLDSGAQTEVAMAELPAKLALLMGSA